MILGEFNFTGRKKRPPTDPVNAILSLSYTMIFNELSSLLDGLGLDPYLGYFHNVNYGRASLAADLIEEFRAPIADRFTLNLINNRIVGKKDFYTNPKGAGVYLKREALKRYFTEYETMLNHEFIHPKTKKIPLLESVFAYRQKIWRQPSKMAVHIFHLFWRYNPSVLPCILRYTRR